MPEKDQGKGQIVTPYICCKGAAKALEFYKAAFGAEETMRFTSPDGVIGHAEIVIEGGHIMLSDEWPDGGIFSPDKYGGTTFATRLVVADVDAIAKVGSSRVDLQACKLEYSIVSPK